MFIFAEKFEMKKALILTLVIAIGMAASYFFAEEWERSSREERTAAVNDSLSNRVSELIAAADSLEKIGNEGREDDERLVCAYIESLKCLREARKTASLATPPLPDPVSEQREKRLVESLVMIDTVLSKQLTLVEGMPAAMAPLKQRMASIDSLVNQ